MPRSMPKHADSKRRGGRRGRRGAGSQTPKEIELEDGKIPMDTRTPEYAEHCRNGHPYNPGCMVCNQGYMRSKMAVRSPGDSKKGESYIPEEQG